MIRLDRKKNHFFACPCTRVEINIKRTIRFQPRDTVERCTIITCEPPSNQDFIVRLDHNGIKLTISPRTRSVERCIQTTVRFQPRDTVASGAIITGKIPSNQDLAIRRLYRNGTDSSICPRSRVEISIQAPISIQPRDTVASDTIITREHPTDQDLTIRLDRKRNNFCVSPSTRVENSIQGTVSIQTRDTVASDTIITREHSTDQDLTIRQDCNNIDSSISPRNRVERTIQTTIYIQSRNTVTCDVIICREPSHDKDLTIRLDNDRSDFIIGPRTRVERCIQTPISIQPRNAAAGGSIITREPPSDQDLTVRLDRNCIDLKINPITIPKTDIRVVEIRVITS